jgi:proteasome assembly chaperone (PAC2) family protein
MTDGDMPLYELYEDVTLMEPVLIVGLEGWIDAGLGASAAIQALLESSPTELLAGFDDDRLLDQRARRPAARIADGVTTSMSWPAVELRTGVDLEGRDVLYLVGPEPDMHWNSFVDAVVELAQRLDVRLVVGLGAFPAPAPHTRPIRLTATVPESSARLLEHFGLVVGEFEVPAGISTALELGFGERGIDMITLWARVPHYVASMPFPQASEALIEGLCRVAELSFDVTQLATEADGTLAQIDDLVASNPEHVAMVRSLESAVDAAEGNTLGIDELPTGDELAAELERFLRGEES